MDEGLKRWYIYKGDDIKGEKDVSKSNIYYPDMDELGVYVGWSLDMIYVQKDWIAQRQNGTKTKERSGEV